jgi:hypothetical protein
MRLRRSLISKLFAVWFVVLIVLPFTAPFRAWDEGTPISKPVNHDLKASDKLAKDAAIAVITSPVLLSIVSVVIHAPGIGAPPPSTDAPQTILRL